MDVLQRLAEGGNTLVIIEHNLDVMKCADWMIDLGPDGGIRGGRVVAVGTPEQIAAHPTSYTGEYLRKVPGIEPVEAGKAPKAAKPSAKKTTRKKETVGTS